MADNDNRNNNRVSRESRRRIAEEARRRIELIASRIPGARALVKPVAPEAVADRLVVALRRGADEHALERPWHDGLHEEYLAPTLADGY